MLGCVLVAFALCAPPGYYGPAYAYPPPQPVYYQPAPVYYAPVAYPPPMYPAAVVGITFGGGRGYYNGGRGHWR